MPADPKTNVEPYENLTSSQGPHAPVRDKSPEHQYKPSPGDNNNRTDAKAPGGPVNIRVKGGKPAESGPAAAGQTEDKATGKGSRDASAGLPEE